MIRRTKALLYRGTLAVAVTVCYLLYHSELVLSVCGHTSSKEETSATDLESLVLTEQQCAATFPGLTKEIDDIVARGPFTLDRRPDDYTGLVHGRIKDGKITIHRKAWFRY
ncbi:hypothetical protein CJF30_00004913 [Rutstroemia sp. NJR-2017a BBW]|nr:hypothetical protein CJF30_00004913 [Rutstroemia sp. NJR-2017a BBW]